MRDDMTPAFQLPHLIQFLDSGMEKNAAFPSFPRSTSITIMRQSSLFLKSESNICSRIPTFPSFVSHELLAIIGFPAFPGTSSQAFPAFLYQSKTFPAFPEIPNLSIPRCPIFPSSTYKNFNIFKNPGNSHLTQLFSPASHVRVCGSTGGSTN